MTKPYLVCIDSDGCVFDTMEIKHKECFCPAYIDYFGLQAVSKFAREAWDFSNLYSATRGINRFKALLRALDVMEDRKEVLERNFKTPRLADLREYVKEGGALNNSGLEEYLAAHPEKKDLRTVLDWSNAVNRRIKEMVHSVPPFPKVRECLKKLSEKADIVIVSATPEDALEREWKEHGLFPLLLAVKGQESGTKKEIIASFRDQYAPGHILMLGDAPGDYDAARANGGLFYPICPGEEAKSWADFERVIPAFLEGKYRGEMEEKAIGYFQTLLPKEPAWEKGEKIAWGGNIGQKFYGDGRARRYPGNTVVAAVTPDSPAYDVMVRLRKMLVDSPLADYYIMLPEDSYHMTVIQGLNDQVRTDAYWPKDLPRDLPMEKVDDYVSAAIARAGLPDGVRMRFVKVVIGGSCVLVHLAPADEEAASILRTFRDRAANELRHRLPGHESYTFHISLAYTRVVPSTPEEIELNQTLLNQMNQLIESSTEFVTGKPYMAYYDDMLAFSPKRLPR